eukprot:Nitzschia sp. Nitz4//scaffold121_size67750//16701//18257//NITZ4_006064-RA/size67750-processed-gene-0.5-mRNA-1//1//CDS//3329534339//4980//frame0
MAAGVVGSIDFFHYFDALQLDAKSLESASEALKTAKLERESSQKKLANGQKKLRKTKAFIKEQRDRINLVSHHWFYGTTIFQPQLWLRGGCQGKIERARIKLARAQEDELPKLQETIQQIQVVELPRLEAQVHRHLTQFEISANAASERQVMRHRVVQQFPSHLLLKLTSRQEEVETQIKSLEKDAEGLEDVISQLFQGDKVYDQALAGFATAKRHNKRLQELQASPVLIPRPLDSLNSKTRRRSETLVADGTKVVTIHQLRGPSDAFHVNKRGKVLATNFPCPNGCGFVVTWHETHCCGACQRYQGCHGLRCDSRPIDSQIGAQQKLIDFQLKRKQHARKVSSEEDACNRSFSEARSQAKQAERMIHQALRQITPSVRERYPSECTRLIFAPKPCGCPHGGANTPSLRAMDIAEEEEAISFHRNLLSQHSDTVRKLQTSIRHEKEKLDAQRCSLDSEIEGESDHIFEQLRSTATETATHSIQPEDSFRPPAFAPHDPSSIPTPTAPSEEDVYSGSFQ